MKALGMPSGDLRKPLTGLDADALGKGLRIVADLELHKAYGYKLRPISAFAA
jgi:4-hydroxy-tetrahydrodipicolinate synthase